MIKINQLMSIYNHKTPFEFKALHDINTTFEPNKIHGIIGHTGSGKSTFIQHLNALLLPSSGEVIIGDTIINKKTKAKVVHKIRRSIGMVFQFPENQLFEETVMKDVMFGPLNIGIDEETARKNAEKYLTLLGIDESEYEASPFELSGGQMRKVAIAGILSMDQDTIIFDEPTAGLDPKSHIEVMDLIYNLNREHGKTIILVSHNMDDCYQYTDTIKIFSHGEIVSEGDTVDLLQDETLLTSMNLELPKVARLTKDLKARGFNPTLPPRSTDEFINMYEKWRSSHAE